MDEVARLFYQCIYCRIVHFEQPATLAVVHKKSLRLYRNNRSVAAGNFKAFAYLKSFDVAVLSHAD